MEVVRFPVGESAAAADGVGDSPVPPAAEAAKDLVAREGDRGMTSGAQPTTRDAREGE
eukprot:CAMPEP_0179464496 /NCGR_PEP_ID=MMETSP0799-20121207/46298_1 /TAXON_ID=46947 /ORGANISM="Geminigera cryophila, Strain CCMP2564" /LENGTH=57 /DNA_ID=CAMNT_0021268309 /DNA_START=91 /DNA_END=264 /DNA_ORIENTATION=+